MRVVQLVVAASLVAALPALAQDKGTVEIGAFAKLTKYPDIFGPTRQYSRTFDDHGIGGRLGYFVARNLALEVDGSYNNVDLKPDNPLIPETAGILFFRDLEYEPFHLGLVYNAPIGRKLAWEIGGNGSYNHLDDPVNKSSVGFGGLTGLRYKLSQHLNIRGEGTVDYVPSGFNSESQTYLGAQLGVSLLFGGKGCNHDTDMIGIRPMNATLAPGESQTFSADATYCGAPDKVVYRLNGPGSLDSLTGRYTASTPGSATVTAWSAKGKLSSAANVTVRQPAAPQPPPPPARQVTPPPPPPPPPAPPKYQFELQMVHFRFDHSDLTKGGIDTVKAVAATLRDHPEVNVDVIGHTDWVGTNAYNMKLSQARAETVRKLLVSEGVADSRISVKWRGEEEPIADNKTVAGRALNRRTEIKQNN